MTSTDSRGRRIRSRSSKATYWGKTGRAYLNTPFRGTPAYRITTELPDSRGQIAIEHSGIESDSGIVPGILSIDWILKKYIGQEERLEDAVGSLVYVNGFDLVQTGSIQRTDNLFYHGEVEVILVEEPEHRFNLGNVVGLTITSADVNYPVWPVPAVNPPHS